MEFQGLYFRLRKIEPEDIKLVASWLASDTFKCNLYSVDHHGDINHEAVVERYIKENADDFIPNKYFIIEKKSDCEAIGLVLLKSIDWKNRTAEYSLIIGKESYRCSVYGPDVSVSIAYYAFNHLNLNKLTGYVYQFNHSSQKLHAYASEIEGVLRKHHLVDGNYVDVVIHGITRNKFQRFLAENKNGVLTRYFQNDIFRKL